MNIPSTVVNGRKYLGSHNVGIFLILLASASTLFVCWGYSLVYDPEVSFLRLAHAFPLWITTWILSLFAFHMYHASSKGYLGGKFVDLSMTKWYKLLLTLYFVVLSFLMYPPTFLGLMGSCLDSVYGISSPFPSEAYFAHKLWALCAGFTLGDFFRLSFIRYLSHTGSAREYLVQVSIRMEDDQEEETFRVVAYD